MTEKDFIEELTELLDTEQELSMDMILSEIDEWDSLSQVSFMGFCMSSAKSNVTSTMIKEAQSIRDLYNLVAV